jgi:hypothetical protein
MKNIKINDWASLFVKVYGDKAIITIAGFLTALFSDWIFKQRWCMPLIFLYGKPATGKTEQCKSILTMLAKKEHSLINLTHYTTTEAKNSLKMDNSFVLFDEYNNSLCDDWIEFMKNIYVRQGMRTIKKGGAIEDASINSMAFICGQEIPSDIALFSRCVFLSFQEIKYSKKAQKNYERLKTIEALANTNEIICHRQIIEIGYMDEFYKIEKEISNECEKNTDDRVIRNYATLITTYKLLQDVLGFEVKYEKLKEISVQCIKEQMMVMK